MVTKESYIKVLEDRLKRIPTIRNELDSIETECMLILESLNKIDSNKNGYKRELHDITEKDNTMQKLLNVGFTF